jgi:hypothetical protein
MKEVKKLFKEWSQLNNVSSFAETTHAEVFMLMSMIGCACNHGLALGVRKKRSTPLIFWICFEFVSICYLIYFLIDIIRISSLFVDFIHLFVYAVIAVYAAGIFLLIELFSMYFACCMFKLCADYEVCNLVSRV